MDSPDTRPVPALRATLAEARRAPNDPGRLSALMLRHGSAEVRWYAPTGTDEQVPHDRDELYVIVSGTATFVRGNDAQPFDDVALRLAGEQRVTVQPGDVLFVPAGAVHRFEGLSGDFGTWVIFYGPEGGEAA